MDTHEIERMTTALANGEKLSWGQIGYLLDEVDRIEYWAHNYDSMTMWVKALAEQIGIQHTLLHALLFRNSAYLR